MIKSLHLNGNIQVNIPTASAVAVIHRSANRRLNRKYIVILVSLEIPSGTYSHAVVSDAVPCLCLMMLMTRVQPVFLQKNLKYLFSASVSPNSKANTPIASPSIARKAFKVDGILPNLIAQNGVSDDQPVMLIDVKGIKRKKQSSEHSCKWD